MLAHTGSLAGAWTLDPWLVGGLVLLVVVHHRGRRRGDRAAQAAFVAGVIVLAVALISPLDALSEELASAHMVQHVLLMLVAAPLLAWSAPGAALVRGSPPAIRSATRRLRRGAGLDATRLRRTRTPVGRWLAFVTCLWLWHASVLYGAAVEHDLVHLLQHATFLGTAFAVWTSLLGPARARASRGFAVLGIFALALQSTFLSALLTFARRPWYEPYLDTAPAWGLDPLADQHLAGVLMWIPAGLVHVGIALALLLTWLREIDRDGALS